MSKMPFDLDEILRDNTTATMKKLQKQTQGLNKIARSAQKGITNNDALIDATVLLFRAAHELDEHDEDEDGYNAKIVTAHERAYHVAQAAYTDILKRYAVGKNIAQTLRMYELDPLESKILLICSCATLGLASGSINDVEDLVNAFNGQPEKRTDVLRYFGPDCRLVRSGLMGYVARPRIIDCRICPNESFTRALLNPKHSFVNEWACESQDRLLGKMRVVRNQFCKWAEQIEEVDADDPDTSELHNLTRQVSNFYNAIRPEWPLADLKTMKLRDAEKMIVTALLCKEVAPGEGPACTDAEMYTGEWLARIGAEKTDEIRDVLRKHLMPGSRLLEENIIRGRAKDMGSKSLADESTAREMEYELVPEFLNRLKVVPEKKRLQAGRAPEITMDQLCLAPEVEAKLDLAVSQLENLETFVKWGVGETIPYGNGMTMLFWGPPGVGKTACCEALAAKLGKRILVADYSKILDCWVGGTPKHIKKVFADAEANDCVLVWDECDAMFYSREGASKNWEVQDVNVLLQELERFKGVCILSTNYKVHLDAALARRVALKVEFTAPTGDAAVKIWQKLLPPKMPLAKDVNLADYAGKGLTGGEIKNCVLNVARLAARRGPKAKAERRDFEKAIADEIAGRSTDAFGGRKVGFHTTCKMEK